MTMLLPSSLAGKGVSGEKPPVTFRSTTALRRYTALLLAEASAASLCAEAAIRFSVMWPPVTETTLSLATASRLVLKASPPTTCLAVPPEMLTVLPEASAVPLPVAEPPYSSSTLPPATLIILP